MRYLLYIWWFRDIIESLDRSQTNNKEIIYCNIDGEIIKVISQSERALS